MAEDMNAQVIALRQELENMKKMVSDQAAKAKDDIGARVSKGYDAAAPKARQAVAQSRSEGTAISEAAREHPTAATSIVLASMAVGMVIGYFLGSQSAVDNHRWYR